MILYLREFDLILKVVPDLMAVSARKPWQAFSA
jgi:hypothetical protein